MSALLSSGGSHRFDTYDRRILTVEEVGRYREEGFLRVPTLTRRSEIAWIGSMIDRLYAHEGLAYRAIDRPSRLVLPYSTPASFDPVRPSRGNYWGPRSGMGTIEPLQRSAWELG